MDSYSDLESLRFVRRQLNIMVTQFTQFSVKKKQFPFWKISSEIGFLFLYDIYGRNPII